MGMSTGNGGGRKGALSEINVTPLVDVMLVLLIIFMVAAGVQTVEMEAEREQTLEEAERILEEARALKDEERPKHQEVGVDLPKVDNEALDLDQVKKLKLVVTHDLQFSIDETPIVDCLEISPEMKDHLDAPETDEQAAGEQAAFEPCLKALGEKLVDNRRLQEDQEIYVLADRRLDYGKVLRVMAAVRQSGVTKFGLVAEPGLLGAAEVEPTPEDLE